MEKTIEIPFGAKDSELKGWEYTIPEDMEAEIKDGKIIVREKESDDERIRKRIISRLQYDLECNSNKFTKREIPEEIAYLEKQKEQKPESCDCSRDEESYTNGIHHVLMNPEAYGLIKQKPAEWSEDDEKQIRQIERIIKGAGCSKTLQAKIHNWLKSLRPDTFQNGNSRWKPSKVQMKALNEVANDGVLLDLFNDLLKLL